jgi:hypothetical protein
MTAAATLRQQLSHLMLQNKKVLYELTFAGTLKPLEQEKAFRSFLRTLFRHNWVVYAKPPFGGPQHVIAYLGRYTHRVAISNHRLVAFDQDQGFCDG